MKLICIKRTKRKYKIHTNYSVRFGMQLWQRGSQLIPLDFISIEMRMPASLFMILLTRSRGKCLMLGENNSLLKLLALILQIQPIYQLSQLETKQTWPQHVWYVIRGGGGVEIRFRKMRGFERHLIILQVTYQQGQDWATSNGNIPYFESSAKDNVNLDQIFLEIARISLSYQKVHPPKYVQFCYSKLILYSIPPKPEPLQTKHSGWCEIL